MDLVKNNLARSANPRKSFCYFWLLPKVESPLPYQLQLTKRFYKVAEFNAESRMDSANLPRLVDCGLEGGEILLLAKAKSSKNFLDSTELQNLIQNNCAKHPKLARFVVQKIGIKGAEVPPADFLLETDKRGSPPKSEKAAAFWRVGGAGRGVQPFLRKESSEFEGEESAESTIDSNAESAVESSKKFALDSVKFTTLGCLKLVRERGFYFWDKPKVAKTFFGASHSIFLLDSAKFAESTRQCEFAESTRRGEFAESRRISQNLAIHYFLKG